MTTTPDPSGYGAAVIELRQTVDRFEHLAAMVASGHSQQLPPATEAARAAVIAARTLAAWCERQAFRVGA